MSHDPWLALESQRRRRHWRGWPWGWIALGLAVAAWACVFMLAFLVMASVGMPGDGSHAIQAVRIPLMGTLGLTVSVTLGCIVASILSLRLPHRPAGGVVALALLALLVLVLALPSLLQAVI